jgi:D-alanyl-D-alanine endopeptidase (penicillin-binding protein 7)
MSRIKRLVRPDTQALNWKAAIPVLGLAAALLVGCVNEPLAITSAHATITTLPILNSSGCTKPMYPHQELRRDKTGTVTLAFLIGSQGKVLQSKVTESSGHAALDDEAHHALAKCRFTPATADGKPQQAWTTVKYVWSLQ